MADFLAFHFEIYAMKCKVMFFMDAPRSVCLYMGTERKHEQAMGEMRAKSFKMKNNTFVWGKKLHPSRVSFLSEKSQGRKGKNIKLQLSKSLRLSLLLISLFSFLKLFKRKLISLQLLFVIISIL